MSVVEERSYVEEARREKRAALEARGIPAVAVITDRFAQSVRAIAAAHGLPDYAFATIAHPIADNDEQTLRAKAEHVAAQLVGLLTGPRRE